MQTKIEAFSEVEAVRPKPLFRRIDKVFLGLLTFMGVLALIDGPQVSVSLRFVAGAIAHILPFFLFAVLFAAYTKATGLDQLIAKAFSGRSAMTIVLGSLAGALSPFCSCGVIPLIAAMLASGVPFAPVMAFCISSPVMDPEMFILTAAGISMDFAVAKTLAAFGLGIMAGISVLGLQRAGYLVQPLKQTVGCGCSTPGFDASAKPEIAWKFWRKKERVAAFADNFRHNAWFLGKWMTLAFFIESLMVAYIPAEVVISMVGSNNPFAIALSAIVGIPAYMNGYAAIPLISGLLDLGMTPGAALAFATAGAVSSIPAAVAMYALLKRRAFFVYIALGLIGSIAAGYAYHLV